MARMSHRGITHTKVAKTKVASRDFRLSTQASRRRGGESGRTADSNGYFVPPEDWHEPTGDTGSSYKFIYQSPGEGFCHVLAEDEIRSRLAELPEWMIEGLEVVQLSRLTKK